MEWRLRALQQELDTNLLLVAGIDGRDNTGTFEVFRWLLENEKEEEPDDETVLLVTKSGVSILYSNPREPLLRCGLNEYFHHDELSKCKGFRQMLEDSLEDREEVGACCSPASSSPSDEVEFWPLVQSLASEDVHESPFFFSNRYTPVDAPVSRVIASFDPIKLERTFQSANKLLRHHIDQLVPDQNKSSDILETFATYGSSSDQHETTFAVGIESQLATGNELVFQAQDPTSGILVCRSYFLNSRGNLDRSYSELVRSFQQHCPTILSQHDDNHSRKIALEKLLSNCTCFVQNVDQDLVYVRAWIRDDESIHTVAVGDTFLVGHASSRDEQTWLVQGESGLVTGDRCAPYVRSWHLVADDEENRALLLRDDPHLSRDLLDNKVISNVSTNLLSGDDQLLPRTILKAKVDLYQAGLVFSLDGDDSKRVVSIKRGDVSDAFVVGRLGDDTFALALDLRGDSALLAGNTVALTVRHNSENHRSIQSLLPTWRDHIRRADGAESEDRESKRESFRRVFDTVFGKAKGDELVDAFTKTYRARIFDGLWMENESPSRQRREGTTRSLYGLIGLPGSGVLEVAATIKRRGKETEFEDGQDSWCVVHAVLSTTSEIDKEATAAAIDQVDGRLVLVVACCRDHVLSLLSAMDRSRLGNVRGCGLVLSEEKRRCHKSTWDQCVPGLTTVAVEFGELESIHSRIRTFGSDRPVRLVSASRGSKMGYGTSIVASLLDVEVDSNYLPKGRTFAQVNLPLKKKWEQEAVVSVDFVLDRGLLEKAVRHLLPRAKHVASRIAALAPNNTSESSSTVLKGLLEIATEKTKADARLETWDRDIDGWTHTFVSDQVSLSGIVRMSSKGASYASPVGFDANSAVFSTWPDTTTSDDDHHHHGFVVATGLTEDALMDLLKLCAKDRMTPIPPKQLKHFTPDELAFSNYPLPPGWAFDGSCYVDSFGSRSKTRPDIDQLVTLNQY